MHFALDKEEVALVTHALRELMFKRLDDVCTARTRMAKEGAGAEVERIKSILTRMHWDECKQPAA